MHDRGIKMDILKQITDTLTLMGAKPTTTTDNNGNTYIKVNAPKIDEKRTEK